MTLLIHVVGASDLGIDIRQYPVNDRKSQLGRRLEEVQSLLGAAIEDESASEALVDALLDGGEGEFSLSPLAQVDYNYFPAVLHFTMLATGILFIVNFKMPKPKNTTLGILIAIVAISLLKIFHVF